MIESAPGADDGAAARPVRRPATSGVALAAVVVALVVAVPLIAIVTIALGDGGAGLVDTLFGPIIPRATRTTLLLVAGVCGLSGLVGVVTAWLVATFDFPLRRMLAVALVLPLAVPPYLAAYTFAEFLAFTGPMQSLLRSMFGFVSARDYAFPDIRSLPGAVLVLASVLYPYVYLTVRAVFAMEGRSAADAARTLGAAPLAVFRKVQVPMARPAIAIGMALVAMETLNDIGAVEYLGVQTLTFSIYDLWLNRGDLAGAARIACALIAAVILLLAAERHARRRLRFATNRTGETRRAGRRVPLGRLAGLLATLFCLLPVAAGAGLPLAMLGTFAVRRLEAFAEPRLHEAVFNSVAVGVATAVLTVALALGLAYAVRMSRAGGTGAGGFAPLARRAASLGYAIPGTVLAIGVLIPLAALDNALDAASRSLLGLPLGLIITGSGAAIVYAGTVRFLTMADGSIESGFAKVSPHVDMAARTLGRTPRRTLTGVLVPLMTPAILTAALLVFIDTIKELSATIVLRPFDFNTLATLVYEDASRAQVEDASVAALLIVLISLIPVLALTAREPR